MRVFQKEVSLPAFSRGFHLITEIVEEAVPQIGEITIGVCHIFIKHTSASISLNENADPTVRHDLEAHFNKMVPENQPYYQHTLEGSDDMPAHIKAALLGSSLQCPISEGRLNLGRWQGIYLCEHRNQAGPRKLVISLWGN